MQQVARELLQHPLVGPHNHRRVDGQLEVQRLVGHQRRQVERDLSHDGAQVERHRFRLLAQLLDLGERQHLVGQRGRALHRLADFAEGLLRRHVAAPGRLHLRLQHRQRRAQLVAGVAHEALLLLEQCGQARHHGIGGLDHRLQLARRADHVHRRQVVGRAFLDGFAQLAHRPRGALHHEQRGERDHAHQEELPPQRVDQQLARQRLADLERLGHLHHRHAAAARTGHRLQQHRHAHRLVAELGVVEIDQRRVRAAVGDAPAPERQFCKARDHFAVERRHPVEEPAAVVGLEGLERGVGHDRAQLRHLVVALHVELLTDGLGGGQQRAVVGGGGGGQALAVQAHAVDHDENGNRREDAEQQPRAKRGDMPHASGRKR